MAREIFLSPEESEEVLSLLSPEYVNLTDAELYDLVSSKLEGLTDEQIESWLGALGGGAATGAATGAALGSIVPGVGTAIGGLAGGVLGGAGGLVKGLLSRRRRRRGRRSSRSRIRRRAAHARPRPRAVIRRQQKQLSASKPLPPTATATSSAATLLGLIQNPLLLQALLSIPMGSARRESIPVMGREVPVEDFLNVISETANKAYKEAIETRTPNPDSYVQEVSEDLDPADPEQRAEALSELLLQEQELELEDSRISEEDDYDDLYDEIANAGTLTVYPG